MFEYHNRWKKLRAEDLVYAPQTTWTHELKGFRIKKDTVAADPSGYMAPTDELAPMPRLSELYLRSIAKICRDNGTKLVLVSTPSTVNWNTARHNRTQLLASELGIDYIDFNMGSQRVEIDWATDTCDKGDHLNIYGAQKVTSKLGEVCAPRTRCRAMRTRRHMPLGTTRTRATPSSSPERDAARVRHA